MGEDVGAGSGMQFDKVETTGAAAPPACAQCRTPLDEYFETGGRLFCRSCVDAYRGGRGRGSFSRGVLFGAGGAILGAIGAAIFYAVTNSTWGFVGIAVGLLVGVAVRKGARGLGGPKYQALAMVLTYVSIASSYMPILIKGLREGAAHKTAGADATAKPAPGDDEAQNADDATAAGTSQGAQLAVTPKPAEAAGTIVLAYLFLFGLALVLPFIGGQTLIGWIIIGIALYEAWKLNRRVPLSGPFRFGGALSVPAPVPVTPGMPPPAAP